MYKSFGLQVKKPDETHADFMHHWLNVHAPMSVAVPGLYGYVLNEVLGDVTPPGAAKLDMSRVVDGIAQLWFDQPDGLAGLAKEPAVQRWFSDGPNYVGERLGFIAVETVVAPVTATPRPTTKLVTLIGRNPAVSAEDFKRRWQAELAPAAGKIAGAQGLTLSAVASGNASVQLSAFSMSEIDGFIETWLDGPPGGGAAAAVAQAQAWAGAADLIGKIRVLLTREIVIMPPKG